MKKITKKIWDAWKNFGMRIAAFVSFSLLTVLYLAIFAPIGIGMLLWRFCLRKKATASYWVSHDATGDTMPTHQF